MCNTRKSGGTESKKNMNVRYRYALTFDRGSSHVLTVSTMVLIDDIILLVAHRSPLLINTPVHVVHPHNYMVMFSMAVIFDGKEWLGLVGGGGGYL